jgi:hypothetical protein
MHLVRADHGRTEYDGVAVTGDDAGAAAETDPADLKRERAAAEFCLDDDYFFS